MVIKEELIKGFAKNTHPYGCMQEVLNQINYCKKSKSFTGPKKVLMV